MSDFREEDIFLLQNMNLIGIVPSNVAADLFVVACFDGFLSSLFFVSFLYWMTDRVQQFSKLPNHETV